VLQSESSGLHNCGRGKSGGARIIYCNADDSTIWLLIVYTKAWFDNLPTTFLAQLKREIEDVP